MSKQQFQIQNKLKHNKEAAKQLNEHGLKEFQEELDKILDNNNPLASEEIESPLTLKDAKDITGNDNTDLENHVKD